MCSAQIKFESLDAEKICGVIELENRQRLTRLDVFHSINSTNTYLLECAKSGAPSGFACFSELQTKGRGRLGREWYSPQGANIYCSLLWNFHVGEVDLSGLGIAVAVIVANVLQNYGVITDIGLKWPNDVLYAQRKLAGILLESLPEKAGEVAIVIGIGLNVKLSGTNPEEVNWADLTEAAGRVVDRNYLAGLLINELLKQLPVYQSLGLRVFADEWRKRDILHGKSVIVHIGPKQVLGVMQGINEYGEMILKTGAGELQSFRSGEVSVRPASSSLS